jgi:hypothetical protein
MTPLGNDDALARRALEFKALMYLAALDNLAFLAGRPHERAFVLEALPGVLRAIANLTAEVNP